MILPLEKQVCDLKLARRIAHLGVKQESLFYYRLDGRIGMEFNSDIVEGMVVWNISAFTVAELGDMLPNLIKLPEFEGEKKKVLQILDISTWHGKTGLKVGYYHLDRCGASKIVTADTEANARAKMFIYLLENKLIDKAVS